MPANSGFVEWLDPQTEVIEISTLPPRSGPTDFAEFAIDGHQVDDGSARAQLDKANLLLPPFNGATKRAAIEVKHGFQIDNPQNKKMINLANLDHGICVEAG
jgi:hypothetical protein